MSDFDDFFTELQVKITESDFMYQAKQDLKAHHEFLENFKQNNSMPNISTSLELVDLDKTLEFNKRPKPVDLFED
jgi:hypothetical protein